LLRLLLAAATGAAVAVTLAACGTGGLATGSADLQNGRKLFQDKCAGCHTLAAAGAQGTIGPNLDDAFAEARAEGFKETAIREIVFDQIKLPGQYATSQDAKDFLTANMPANLVTGKNAVDVATYVAQNAGVQGFSEAQAVSGTNGKAIFVSKCGGCHTLKSAGTTGTQGPNLDQLKPPFAIVKHQVINGGRIMPAFKGILNDAQIEAVARYVAQHAGK
jgi:cbb3-type cytochrome c oxidase subunit III